MQLLTPLAVVIAAILISAAVLHSDRFQILQGGDGVYVVHDTWRGDLIGCSLNGAPPAMNVACAPIRR